VTPAEKRRRERNAELCEAVKQGHPIPPLIPASATWFQPRAMVKRDPKERLRIFTEPLSPPAETACTEPQDP
jgi:hypothetical protein